MGTIVINSKIDKETKIPTRSIELEEPDCIAAEDLSSTVDIISEAIAYKKINDQLKIDFRAHIRTKLESTLENGEYTNTDEDILALDFSDWKPEARVRKSNAEKVRELLGKCTPEEVAAALASLEDE